MKSRKKNRFLYIPHISTLLYALGLIYGLVSNSPFSHSSVFYLTLLPMAVSLIPMKNRDNRGGIHLFLTSAFLTFLNFQHLSTRFPHPFTMDYGFFILLVVLSIFLLEFPQNICFVVLFSSIMMFITNRYASLTREDVIIMTITTLLILFVLFEAKKWMSRLHNERIDSMRKLQNSTLRVLGRVCEIKDVETTDHLKRVEIMVGLLVDCLMDHEQYAEYLTYRYREDIKSAAYLHDIGKIGVSDRILNKPGGLTAEEFSIVKTHTVIGYSLIVEARQSIDDESIFDLAQEIARHHHEKWDGTGYPDGLAGEAIPLSARIMAVVDVYDALISKRPYKEAFSHAEAMEIIRRDAGTHFDPVLAYLFSEHSVRLRRMLEKIRRVEITKPLI